MKSLLRAVPVLALMLMALLSQPALAQKRIALVVGNSNYANVPVLANPANDAGDVSKALRKLGFEVIAGTDLGQADFAAKLKAFGDRIGPSDETYFFYAGHGLQAKGVNYLIPIDARLASERDLDFEAVPLDLVLRQMKMARTKVIMLDACRNNPFARSLARSMGTRSVSDNLGLAVTVASDLGTFIAYATQPGNVASDGEGRNSPFTQKLMAHIATPGQSITDLMMVVRNEVAVATEGRQIPWEHSALAAKFFFQQGAPTVAKRQDQTLSEAAEAWGWIRNTSNTALLEEFIRRYGQTAFGEKARSSLAALSWQTKATPATFVPDMANVSLRPVQPSFDCKKHYGDAEVAICNSPELSILDNELSRVYVAAYGGADASGKAAILAAQRQWIGQRDACGVGVACLAAVYQTRIRSLSGRQRGLSTPAPQARPSFDCAKHSLPAELAVCADVELARLDVEIDAQYRRTSKGLSGLRKRALIVDQRQWLGARDTCGSDKRCLSLQYRARIAQLKVWQ